MALFSRCCTELTYLVSSTLSASTIVEAELAGLSLLNCVPHQGKILKKKPWDANIHCAKTAELHEPMIAFHGRSVR